MVVWFLVAISVWKEKKQRRLEQFKMSSKCFMILLDVKENVQEGVGSSPVWDSIMWLWGNHLASVFIYVIDALVKKAPQNSNSVNSLNFNSDFYLIYFFSTYFLP